MSDQRTIDAARIEAAYEDVEKALGHVGRLLRTTEAGKFLWSSEHKSAVTGLRVIVEKLRQDVPNYGQHIR